jgi:Tetratricopeptide repeat.
MGLFSRFKKSPKTSFPSDSEVKQEVSETEPDTLKANTLKYDALRALRIGEVDFAIRALRTSLEEIDNPECRLYLAQALQYKLDLTAAMKELRQLLGAYPEYPMALYEATKVSAALDHHTETIEYAKRALETELDTPIQADLYRMTAQAQLALEEYDTAYSTIDQALSVTKEVPLYWLIKVKVLIAQELWDEALALTSETVEAFPEEERTHLYEGLILYQKGDRERAEEAFRKVLEIDPFNVEAYMHLTHLVSELRGATSAADEMEQALEMISQPTKALLEYAKILYEQTGRTERCKAVQQRLAELPEDSDERLGEVNFANLYAGGFY